MQARAPGKWDGGRAHAHIDARARAEKRTRATIGRARAARPLADGEPVASQEGERISFRWTAWIDGIHKDSAVVTMRKDNAKDRDVRLPEFWRIALQARHLPQLAARAARKVMDAFGATSVRELSPTDEHAHLQTRERRLFAAIRSSQLEMDAGGATSATKLDCRQFSQAYTHTYTSTSTHARAHLQHSSRYGGDRGALPTWHSNLAFRWTIAVDGVIHESIVYVRADHAAERGVPLPMAWKGELNFGAAEPSVDVDSLACAAVQRAWEEPSLTNATKLDCRQSSQAYTHIRT